MFFFRTQLSTDPDSDRPHPSPLSAWGAANLSVEWRPLPETTLGFRVENVGDQGYREHGSGIDARGRSVGLWVRTACRD